MIDLQEERIADCWDELYALAASHAAGAQGYRRHEPFNPSKERYQAFNECGMYHLLTARDQGRMVGYFGVYLLQSMHSQMPMAQEDTFYLAPSHRGGRNALRFLFYVEQFIASHAPVGQSVEVLFSCEVDNETGIQGLLKYLDYSPVIMVWSKRLFNRADSAVPSTQEAAHVGSR